jgi:uncharacterized protein (TIRG00374 family)
MSISKQHRRRVIFAIKVVISTALLWYLFEKIELAPLSDRISGLEVAPLVGAFLVVCIQVLVVSIRWRIVVSVLFQRLRLGKILKIVMIGAFFNQALPTALGGDVMRAWYLYLAGARGAHAIYSVFLDRLSALAANTIFMACLLGVIFEMIPDRVVRFGFVVVILGVGIGFLVLFNLGRARIFLGRGRVARISEDLSSSARSVLGNVKYGARVIGLSALSLVCTVLVFYLIGRGFDISVDLRSCFVLVPPVILMSMLPVSVAGWGVRELAMVSAFGYAGVPNADALLMSLCFGLLILTISLPGGLLWLVTARSTAPLDEKALESD